MSRSVSEKSFHPTGPVQQSVPVGLGPHDSGHLVPHDGLEPVGVVPATLLPGHDQGPQAVRPGQAPRVGGEDGTVAAAHGSTMVRVVA